jgi:hypothetical protein
MAIGGELAEKVVVCHLISFFVVGKVSGIN